MLCSLKQIHHEVDPSSAKVALALQRVFWCPTLTASLKWGMTPKGVTPARQRGLKWPLNDPPLR